MRADRELITERTHSNLQQSNTRLIRKSILLIITFAVVAIFSAYTDSGKVSAHDEREAAFGKHKYYKSIEVKAGDTLWDIAEEYMDESYHSIDEYMNELIEINQLGSGRIHEGCYLTVVYRL